MFSYIAFICGETEELGDNAFDEGQALAHQCLTRLKGLEDPEQFPPRLLILFTPPHYRDPAQAKELLAGIRDAFKKDHGEAPPLIGGSAVAVFFKKKVHAKGALLICLASRLFKATVAAAENTSVDADRAIDEMLEKIGFRARAGQDVNPFADRLLFALFPGFKNQEYPAPELYATMQTKLRARAPIFGGVTSVRDPDLVAPGLQFANDETYDDAVVAAGITSGTPIGLSFAHGLTSTPQILQVSELGSDKKTIRHFHQGPALDSTLGQEKPGEVMLLENISTDHQSWMGRPEPGEDNSIRMLRQIEEGAAFRIWRPESRKMHKNIVNEVRNSLQRIRLEKPIACLGIRCAGYYAIAGDIQLPLEKELTEIEKLTGGEYVGAFMAGEAGTDSLGRSYLSNWHTATIIFGDELRDRSTFHKGFVELANHNGFIEFTRLASGLAVQIRKDAFRQLLRLVYEVGFPGAMISLILNDVNGQMIIAQDALGKRYQNVVRNMRLRTDCADILTAIIKNRTPEFVPKSATDRSDGAAEQSTTASEYIIPLITLTNHVIALLQVDLGDHKKKLHANEKVILAALGNVVSSTLNRVFTWEENKIVAGLDAALQACLDEPTIERGLNRFLKMALDVFGLDMGHIRLLKPGTSRLAIKAGLGKYWEFAKENRNEIDAGDPSPALQALANPNKPLVTNNAAQDLHYQEMMKRYDEDPEWRDALRRVGSYINMGLVSANGEQGTISLIAPSPWFFYWHHERACKALGKRLGFLIEHLQRTEQEILARTIRAKVALVAQSSHRFGSLLGELVPMPRQIRSAANEFERDATITRLAVRIAEARNEIKRHTSLADRAMRLNIRPMGLRRLVETCIKTAKLTSPSDIDFKVDISSTLTVETDDVLLRAAFLNLLNNSINSFKEPKSKKPKARKGKSRPKVISITAERDQHGGLEIVFADSGKGMAQSKVERLNKRLDGSTSIRERSPGTGWGLPITTVLLEALGARIKDIVSRTNGGTNVTVAFSPDKQEVSYETKDTDSGR